MKVNDLRIGSRVKCKVSNDSAIYTVVAIDGLNSKVMLSGARVGTWYDIERIKPIPLTKDLLLECGFEYNEDRGLFTQVMPTEGRYILDANLGGGYQLGREFNDDYTPVASVEYLHQLQNLYFFLEGSELPLSL